MKKIVPVIFILTVLTAIVLFGGKYLGTDLLGDIRLDFLKPKEAPVAQQQAEMPKPENGKRNGPFVLYYDDGTVKAERFYKDDQLEGPYKLYHPNGTLQLEGQYKDGKMQGTFKNYDESGKLKSEEIYDGNFLIERKAFEPTF